ncbi:hypothetical protein NL676_027994 [Syzygium grande]|nr:hypothetical protein NL676_027994 [Syzygium grande]
MGGQRWFTTAGQQRQGTLSKAKGSGARFLARQGPSIGFGSRTEVVSDKTATESGGLGREQQSRGFTISTGGGNREPRTVVTRMLAEFWPSLITSLGIERRSGKVRGRAARPPNVRDDREREVLFL